MNYKKIWQEAYGKLPFDEEGRPYEIHHVDGNRANNALQNLKCVSIAEHFAIHQKQGDYMACFLIASRMQLSPLTLEAWRSRLSTSSALKRVNEGSHNFQGNKNPIHALITNGSSHVVDSKWQKEKAQRQIKAGTHNFIANHPKKKPMVCVDCGKIGNLSAFKRTKGWTGCVPFLTRL